MQQNLHRTNSTEDDTGPSSIFKPSWLSVSLLVFIFILPLFIHYNVRLGKPGQWRLVPAHSHFGDQPHYMVMLASLVEDGDLDPSNNYYNALIKRDSSAGLYLGGVPLDHHSILVNKITGEKYTWTALYHYGNLQRIGPENSYREGENIPFAHHYLFPRDLSPEKAAQINLENFREVPLHPPGLPLFAALFVFPFRHSKYLDTAALTLTVLVTLAGLYFLYLTLKHYAPDKAFLITASLAFATPLWLYSKTFFTEPYVAAFLIASYYLVVIKNLEWPGGALLGIAFLMKPASAVALVIFFAWLLYRKEYKRAAAFCIPPALAGAAMLFYNNAMMGSPLAFTQKYITGNPIAGILGTLFDLNSGFFPFAPVLILALFGFRDFFRDKKEEAWLTAGLIVAFILAGGFWKFWDGMTGYASRLLIPIIPLCGIPLAYFLQENREKGRMTAFFILLTLSVLINAPAAFDSIYCWKRPPWAVFRYILFKS